MMPSISQRQAASKQQQQQMMRAQKNEGC